MMRAAFRKHIPKVELALCEQPTDTGLWNLWTWMARGIGDYKWGRFVDTIEPFVFPSLNISIAIPSPEVCAWLVEESRKKEDWHAVINFAKPARFFSELFPDAREEWMPGGTSAWSQAGEGIKDYPAKSAYAPHLEALLRLGRLEEANTVFDELIRFEGKTAFYPKTILVDGKPERYRADNARIAADTASLVGMKDLAEVWGLGEPVSKAPYVSSWGFNGFPVFFTYAKYATDYYKMFYQIAAGLSPALRVHAGSGTDVDIDTLGWKRGDGDRWALIGGGSFVLEQGFGLPEPDALQNILDRHSVISTSDYYRKYMSEHGAQPGLELRLAFDIMTNYYIAWDRNRTIAPSNHEESEDFWAEAASLLRKVLSSHPDVLMNMPYAFFDAPIESQAMKALSKPLLSQIESLLARKPSSRELWSQWQLWREIEGAKRPIGPLAEAVVPSPMAKPGTVPPAAIFNQYYEECKADGKWHKAIGLLRAVWDREYSRVLSLKKKNPDIKLAAPKSRPSSGSAKDFEAYHTLAASSALGDKVGIPLIEAYLMDDKPIEAREIFNAWLDCGGTFTDIAKIAGLARERGQERLAREWEAKVQR